MHRWAKEESELPIHEETISFELNGRPMEFTFFHNFHVLKLDIYKAFDEWAQQTAKPTALDFCGYVMSEEFEPRIVCVSKEEWNEFQLNQRGLG